MRRTSTIEQRLARALSPMQLLVLRTLIEQSATDAQLMARHGGGWRRAALVLYRRGLITWGETFAITDYGRQIVALVDETIAAEQGGSR